jgi:hypothetical protein
MLGMLPIYTRESKTLSLEGLLQDGQDGHFPSLPNMAKDGQTSAVMGNEIVVLDSTKGLEETSSEMAIRAQEARAKGFSPPYSREGA